MSFFKTDLWLYQYDIQDCHRNYKFNAFILNDMRVSRGSMRMLTSVMLLSLRHFLIVIL